MVVVDVGANIGFYTVLFAKLTGKNGRVVAFEPDATNFRHLKEAVRSCGNVTARQSAVGEKNGWVRLYLSGRLNVDHHAYNDGDERRTVAVKMVCLDDFLPDLQVDVMKVDTQGYDFFVIKGAKKLIKKSKRLYLASEFWPYGLKQAGVSGEKYLELLNQLGFKITLDYNRGRANDPDYDVDFVATKFKKDE